MFHHFILWRVKENNIIQFLARAPEINMICKVINVEEGLKLLSVTTYNGIFIFKSRTNTNRILNFLSTFINLYYWISLVCALIKMNSEDSTYQRQIKEANILGNALLSGLIADGISENKKAIKISASLKGLSELIESYKKEVNKLK